jgi:hypothetical protein
MVALLGVTVIAAMRRSPVAVLEGLEMTRFPVSARPDCAVPTPMLEPAAGRSASISAFP